VTRRKFAATLRVNGQIQEVVGPGRAEARDLLISAFPPSHRSYVTNGKGFTQDQLVKNRDSTHQPRTPKCTDRVVTFVPQPIVLLHAIVPFEWAQSTEQGARACFFSLVYEQSRNLSSKSNIPAPSASARPFSLRWNRSAGSPCSLFL